MLGLPASRSAAWRLALLPRLWAAPASLLGLMLGLALGGRVRRVGPALEIATRWGRPLPFAAITLGHVIVGTSRGELERLRAHEHVHLRQFERWGALLLLAYPLASLWAWVRGGRPYRDNAFERAA